MHVQVEAYFINRWLQIQVKTYRKYQEQEKNILGLGEVKKNMSHKKVTYLNRLQKVAAYSSQIRLPKLLRPSRILLLGFAQHNCLYCLLSAVLLK